MKKFSASHGEKDEENNESSCPFLVGFNFFGIYMY